MGLFGGYAETKLKPMLKMSVSRFNMATNKKSALMKQQMREISKLLAEGKEESARIKAEALIRDDGTIEAYEILSLTCDLLFERIKLISSSKTCPEDLKSSIATLIWASNRVDIKELVDIRKQFRSKFGKQFDLDAFENKDNICNERIVAKLSVQPPSAFLVQTYLEKIADQFDVDWQPANRLQADQLAEPMAAPVGYSVQVAAGSGLVPVSAYSPNDDDAVSDLGASVAPASLPTEVAATPPPPPATVPTTNSVAAMPASSSASASVATSQHSNDDKKDMDGAIPVAQAIPMPPEEDIYIPPAPSGRADSKPSADDDDFDALQARFNNLKK